MPDTDKKVWLVTGAGCGMGVASMTSTTTRSDDLRTFAETDDLYVSPSSRNGETLGTPTCIWSVVSGSSHEIGKTVR